MKPIRLELSAFGSYAELEVVDFTNIDHGIFLITGDTGAGKTTIFDGMMYALYDETSGGHREGNMMRSQYASENQETYVQFTFRYRQETYTIRRNPEYIRPGKRRMADGSPRMVKELASVELTLPDGSVYMGKKRDVDRKIEEIIGLDAGQFRQVAMIAQGDFLKLLHAESKERKMIFSRIFHTRIYWKIQENLKTKVRELWESIEESRKLYKREMDTVKCSQDSLYEAQWEKQKASAEFSMEEAIQLLKQIAEEDAEQLKNIKNQRTDLKNRLTQLEELLRREEIWKLCRTKKESNEEQIRTLNRWIEEQKEILEESEKNRKNSNEQLHMREPELSAAITRLSDSLKKYETLKLCQQKEKQEDKKLSQCQKQLEQNEKNQERNQKKQESIQLALGKLENLPIKRLEAEGEIQALEKKKVEFDGLNQKINQQHQLDLNVEEYRKFYEETQELATKYQQKYTHVYELFFKEQAGILAEELKEGDPCPVCGSIHHPKKAVPSSEAPTQAQVELARKKREEAEQKRQQAYLDFGEAKQRQAGQLEQLNELGNQLLGMKQFQLDEKGLEKVAKQVDLVDKSLEKLSKTVDKIQQQEIKQKEYQKEVLTLQEALKSLQQEKVQLEEIRQQILISLGSIQKEAQLLSENLTFEHEAKAKQELRNLQKELAQLRTEAEKAEEEYKKIVQGIHVKSGQEKACQEQQKQLDKELEKAQKVYEAQLELLKELQEDIPAEERKTRQKQLILQERNLEKAYLQTYTIAENNKKALAQLELLEKSQKEQQQKYLLYNDLSRTANGTLQGSIKVDFETYVQRQYFKQIIAAANRRLVRMNHQQFILQCRDMEKLGTQGQVGLDLDVYHLVNDSVRDVKTLSGGESFMAALAMALGLADIIQNEAGAIRLDTMFVDEGFGSLDDEARSQAVQVLLELADDQHLVGIISHVNELKEQIDQKLEVVKNDKGSHIRWVNS